jgi:hypothetical protein
MVSWSDRTATIERTDGYGGEIPVGIHVENQLGELYDITADEAQRLAAALVDLADVLERADRTVHAARAPSLGTLQPPRCGRPGGGYIPAPAPGKTPPPAVLPGIPIPPPVVNRPQSRLPQWVHSP